MGNIQRLLDDRLAAAIREVFPDAADAPAIVMQAQDERFGDYQANGAMALAKRLGKKPREVAADIVAKADLAGIAETPDIAGPGFINITLSPDWLAARLAKMLTDERLGVPSPATRQTIVVDYSAPNLAKEMHVGHLRSTIIGDALVRVLEFLGHEVIRQNHVGDWGTQYGMIVLAFWHFCMADKRNEPSYVTDQMAALHSLSPGDTVEAREEGLNRICENHQRDLDEDPDGRKYFDAWVDRKTKHEPLSIGELELGYQFVRRVEALAEGTNLTITHWPPDRDTVTTPLAKVSSRVAAMVQTGGKDNEQERNAWIYAKKVSLRHCNKVYARLKVRLTDNDVRGESAYNDVLPDVVEALTAKGLLAESEGAQCVFLPEFKAKDGSPLPLIVQKSDEGYLYATTDLAAVRYRVGELKANRVLYVVDARQSLHFRMVFECAYQAGFADRDKHDLVHVGFGMMLGPDNRPFKTREGGTVKLMDLIDEAEKRARTLLEQKQADLPEDQREPLPEEEKERIARIVGIGALKYADLAQNRTKDYVFSWDKMLSLDGNTAPYMQYAFARIHSIARKGGLDLAEVAREPAPGEGFSVAEPAERRLAVALLQFPETVEAVAAECLPHVLCGYLFRLAGAFMGFYETCPVLKAEEPTRTSRLRLCALTAKVIEKGLGLLGIDTAERM